MMFATTDGDEIVNLFASHFESCYNVYDNRNINKTFINTNNVGEVIIFSSAEIALKLVKLENKFSIGPDGIPPSILKQCPNAFSKPLSILFNKSYVSS